MTLKEKLQLQAETEAANTKRFEDWKKGREAQKDMVQISEEVLQRAFYLLNGKRVSLLSKADKISNPERANAMKAKAQEIGALLDDISASLDPKE